MKATWQCPKCQSRRVGYLKKVHDKSRSGDTGRKLASQSVGKVLGMRATRPGGDIEAFVCTECGYFEEYVKDPQSIDWERFPDFRWCRREPRGR